MSKKNFTCPLGLERWLWSIIPHELWMPWYSGICIYTHAQHSGECVHIFQESTISNSSTCNFAPFSHSFLLALQGWLHLTWLTPHNFFFSRYFQRSLIFVLRIKSLWERHNSIMWILACVVQILPGVNRCHHHQEEHNAGSWKGFSNPGWV